MANDFITKKEITNKKNKISYNQTIEELNIYYVAATRARKAIDMASLHLHYQYSEKDASENISYKYKKKTSNKKMKNLQDEWLKNNRVKKAISI